MADDAMRKARPTPGAIRSLCPDFGRGTCPNPYRRFADTTVCLWAEARWKMPYHTLILIVLQKP